MAQSRKLAVVTGGSSGIGYELAGLCAQNGFDLVIAADEPALPAQPRPCAPWVRGWETVQVDLATQAGVERLYEAVRARPVQWMCSSPMPDTGFGKGFSIRISTAPVTWWTPISSAPST